MTPERALILLHSRGWPQVALARVADIPPDTLSLWLRLQREIPSAVANNIEDALMAMTEFEDSCPAPLDWRKVGSFLPQLKESMTTYRRARAAEERRAMEAIIGTAV